MADNGGGDTVWDDHFRSLKRHLEYYGTYPLTSRGNAKLARWVYKQRKRWRMGKLSAERVALLEGIGFNWETSVTEVNRDGPAGVDAVREIRNSHGSLPSYAVGIGSSDKRKSTRESVEFDVDIPPHYKNIYQPSEDSKTSVDQIWNETDEEVKDTNSSVASVDSETHNNDEAGKEVFTKKERLKQHNDFIAALERYGSKSGSEEGTLAWHAIAAELKWSIEDVKVYAYSYFKALTEGIFSRHDLKSCEQEKANSSSVRSDLATLWTSGEQSLFDCLLLKYSTSIDGSKHKPSVQSSDAFDWEKIAAKFPGKTTQELRVRQAQQGGGGER